MASPEGEGKLLIVLLVLFRRPLRAETRPGPDDSLRQASHSAIPGSGDTMGYMV